MDLNGHEKCAYLLSFSEIDKRINTAIVSVKCEATARRRLAWLSIRTGNVETAIPVLFRSKEICPTHLEKSPTCYILFLKFKNLQFYMGFCGVLTGFWQSHNDIWTWGSQCLRPRNSLAYNQFVLIPKWSNADTLSRPSVCDNDDP